jgi:phage tail protein X
VDVTVLADETVTVHCAPATASHPLQVPTVEFRAGVAVSVTAVPLANEVVQELPQLIPAGVLVTVPDPVPARTTEVKKLAAIVNGKAVESPPPGAGVSTVTCAVPAFMTSFARIVACN